MTVRMVNDEPFNNVSVYEQKDPEVQSSGSQLTGQTPTTANGSEVFNSLESPEEKENEDNQYGKDTLSECKEGA
ncbi:hypothetical protein FGO68_gene2280 [Halteria grandinella]|uniref:Uncharacterized protein n=1 Tax=Halteria grandinella TaxID=5974 RepID=A0A8J8T251_HALGN|nr:hypothetical protein FGO68_gene2280 [Halteria grandinella]